MVYFCYSSSLNVSVAYIFLFWISIWPLCGKVCNCPFGFLLVMFPLGSSYLRRAGARRIYLRLFL